MASQPNNTPDGGPDRGKMLTILVPAVGVGLLVILVAVMASMGEGGRKMSDGSDGTSGDSGLKELSTGVKYRDVKEGQGEPCPPGATVTIHYTGWLTNGTVFDSSKDRGQPATFELGGLIKGWQEGIPGMKPGGIRKLVISPEKGYGSQAKGKIPANSTLIFEVELLEVVGGKGGGGGGGGGSDGPGRPMSDGSDGSTTDTGLKDVGGGLKVRDLKEGTGAEVKPGATVVANYTGWLVDGTVFDSSKNHGGPATFPLSGVVQGWSRGLPGMKVGGIRKLVIPSALGYGSNGQGRTIPPDATLIFEVEIVGVK